MHDDDDDQDEAWYDDDGESDSELDDEPSAACPECGTAVPSIAERCPACGYWLTDADRRVMWAGFQRPLWLRVTAVVVLVAFLLGVLGIAGAIF